ncbi:CGNR zinc finger domain-containing protein [Mucilaginibacter sp. BJC16-A38]|uniref:CGNR zinc finger domain-containing protein n=1 Tax=Mucilaginibacter phenanthrenivorans TaxID=1234842 RepID=UPI002156FE4D|nr:CGNR zinc finger domain-containing protein [Mucilaginibacter phenanthrenivorans]MCR8558528.1 CGNR zinc finger domain-containing protein [Mucilaginibacter phenanthrenivorans]
MEDKYTGFLKGRRELYANRDKFPMDGDIPVLQFINTIHRSDTDGRRDYLETYDDFLDWAYDAKVVEEAEYNNLCFESYCYFPEAEKVFEKVIDARNCINDLVVSLSEGVAPYPGTITNFNTHFEEVKKRIVLNMNGYGMLEVWVGTKDQLAFPLWRLIKSAQNFLMTMDGQFIKKCKCGNLFIDRSKNGKRRWCNPATCGSAYWSKEYYRRRKKCVV